MPVTRQTIIAGRVAGQFMSAAEQMGIGAGAARRAARRGFTAAGPFLELDDELRKVSIDEYAKFIKVHRNEWMCFPVNRNARVPVIYVIISGGKYVVGYKFIDSVRKEDYEGSPQDSIAGVLEEIANVKTRLTDLATSEKNRMMDEKMDEEQAAQAAGEEGGEGEGGDEGGGLGDLGVSEEPSEDNGFGMGGGNI